MAGFLGRSYAQQTIKLSGRVTDFQSNPIDSVTIRLKNDKFENLYETITGKDGRFSITVAKGIYFCLYAIKEADYGKSKLEYWAWNIPADDDLEINPQYDRLEIYGLHAFEPKQKPFDTYMLFFRPMSLTKSLHLTNEKNKIEFEKRASSAHDTIDIAPNNISTEEIAAKVNETEAQILTIQKVMQYARGAYMYCYLIQIKKPTLKSQQLMKFDKITIVLHSLETNEYGKGEIFIEKYAH
jgi:hypothetical protein